MFHERETAQLKKHEAFTAEREREIHQASDQVFNLQFGTFLLLCA